MNKVFKVIWNEARNAYVVVSEIAKNRGSKSCSTKKLLAMLIATGVMTCASFDVLAAEPVAAETLQSQYVAFAPTTSSFPDEYEQTIDGHKYIYDVANQYWVREGYILVLEQNAKLHTPLSTNGRAADVAYTGGGDTSSILQSVTSLVSASGTVTNMGESLNSINASAYAGVSHSGGTKVAGTWNYIIEDSSWKDSVAPGNYKYGYVDLVDSKLPKGFKTAEDPNTELTWDDTKQCYTYKGNPVDYSNVYVIDGKIGVFTNKDGSKVYTGNVFGKNNEVLMTVKDANNKFYSYWASEVTDPSATMQSYRMADYEKDLSVLLENEKKLYRNDIKEVTLTTDAGTNSAIIGLVRNGNTEAGASVKGAITVTSGGGTGGQDTFVKISNDTANQTFATGSKVEAIGAPEATTGITINGQKYTIKDTDTKYTAGENVTIDTNNKISVDLSQYAKTVDVAVVYNDKNSLHSTNSGKVGEKAIAFGQNAIADGKFSVAIGDSANVDANSVYTSSGAYSTAVGAASGAWGTQATAVGYNAKAAGRNAVALGFSASASGKDTVAIGANSVANREAGAVGLYAPTGNSSSTWKATSGAVSIGSSTKTRQIINLAAGTADTDAVNVAQLKKVKAEADKHTTLVAGANVTLDKKETENGLQYTINAIGGSNYQAGKGIAIEAENNTISVKLQADSNLVVDSNGLALKKQLTGMESIQGAGEGKISFDGANVKVNNTTFGENSVVVGGGTDGKTPVTINGTDGVVSGLHNTNIGYTDFATKGNAATEEQLKKVMDAGWKFTTDSNQETTVKVGPDGTNANAVTFKGDSANVEVTNTGNNIKVALKNDLTVDSVKAGSSFMSATGIGYGDKAYITSSGLNANGQTITNVKAGEAETDAVNVGQLNAVKAEASKKTTLSNGKNTTVTSVTTDGQTDYKVNVAGDLKDITSVANGASKIKLNADSIIIANTNKTFAITNSGIGMSYVASDYSTKAIMLGENGTTISGGLNVAGSKISGVADGTIAAGSTDAVNGSQLYDVKNSINTDISNKTFGLKDEKGNEVTNTLGNTVQVKGADGITSTVKDGALEIGLKLQEGSNLVVNSNGLALNTALTGIQSINGTGAGSISFNGGNVKVNQNTFNSDGRIQNVANGTETKDAVNFGQLDATNKKVDNLTNEIGKGWTVATENGTATKVGAGDTVKFSGDDNIKVSNTGKDVKVELNKKLTVDSVKAGDFFMDKNEGVGYKGKAYITSSGLNANGQTITNVKAGEAETDAVNVGQLNAVKAEASKKTTLSNGKNTTVTSVTTDGQTDYKVNVAGDLKDITSVANGASEIKLNADSIIIANTNKTFAITNSGIGMSYVASDYSTKAIMLGENGTTISGGLNVAGSKITGVAAGTIAAGSTDAVNGSQLNDIKNSINTDISNKTFGLKDDKGSEVTSTLGNTVQVKGADGITSTVKDGALEIGLKLQDNSNLVVNSNGLALNTALTGIQSITGAGGTINLAGSAITINETTFNKDGRIQNVAAGTETKDAVNFGQLDATNKKVDNLTTEVGKGWTVATENGTATKVGAGDTVKFSGDDNIKVSNTGKDVKVELNKKLTVDSVKAGDFFMDKNEGVGYKGKAYITSSGLNANGQTITNVKAGEAETDAVNVGQLNAVKAEASKKTTLSDGKNTTVTSVTTDGQTDYQVNVAGDLKDITSVSNDASKINLNADSISISNGNKSFAITNSGIGMSYIGADYTAKSIMLGENGTTISGGLNVAGSKITGVAAGTADTDAVNVSQLNKVSEIANKGWKLKTNNGNVSDVKPGDEVEFDGDDNIKVSNAGNKVSFKLNNKLTGIESITGVGGGSISFSGGNVTINNNVTFGSNGQIHNVTAGTASTDAVNVGQLNAAVQAGNTDTHIKPGEYGVGADNKVNMDVVDKNGNKVDTVTIKDVAKASDVGDVNNIASDIKNQDGSHTTVVDAVNNLNNKLDNKVGDLQYSKVDKGDIADGDSTTTAIGKLDQALKDVADTANQGWNLSTNGDAASKVAPGETVDFSGDKNISVSHDGTKVKVELNKDIDVDTVKATTVTTGQTEMNNDGLKVGDKVSVTATAVTAGKTSISDEGVKVGNKTYISDNGLNANDQKVTNVAAGEISATSKDAVNGSQLYATNQEVVNNINRIGQLSSRVNKVGAGAAALAALHPMDFDPDDKLTFSAGYGNYAGQNAAAIGAYYRPDEKVMFSVGGTVGNGENMVNAGISFSLDRTNHVSNSRTALAREVIELRGQLAEMGAKMARMEKAFGMLDESKTKLFPDIPANHWAYEYIAKLAGNGYIEGYPDGNFGGDRLMTRYEFATMLYRAIENGAALEERIIKEFEPELGRIRVDRISGEDGDRNKIERVRVNATKGERDHYGNKLAK